MAVLIAVLADGLPVFGIEQSAVLDSIRVRKARLDASVRSLEISRELVVETAATAAAANTIQTLYLQGPSARLESARAGEKYAFAVVIHHAGRTTEVLPPAKQRRGNRKDFELQRVRWDWWSVMSDSSTIIGLDVVDGVSCWQVSCGDRKPWKSVRYWLDQRTLDCLKGECSDGKGGRLRWKHGDFRELVTGVAIPYLTQTYAGGSLTSSARIRSLERNPEFKPELFDVEKVKLRSQRQSRERRRSSE
ncbi:hypothetical protein HZB60_10680 [candidate division KSB1 bacterium]|nr:hypothetical protein [candidate division KSB1 bacterium]